MNRLMKVKRTNLERDSKSPFKKCERNTKETGNKNKGIQKKPGR